MVLGSPSAAGALANGEAAGPAPAAVSNACTEMRLHLGEGRSAVMRFSESRSAFSLDLILVPSSCRGHGLGTALLERLLALADAVGKPVHTTARPIGRATPEILARLVQFYEDRGFRRVEEGFSSVLMKRPVGSSGGPPL